MPSKTANLASVSEDVPMGDGGYGGPGYEAAGGAKVHAKHKDKEHTWGWGFGGWSQREKNELELKAKGGAATKGAAAAAAGSAPGAGYKSGWGSSWGRGGWGYASMYIWLILAPIVIWIILISWKPSFVTDNINGTNVVNNQKLLLWTLIFSIIAWILIYAIYYCRY